MFLFRFVFCVFLLDLKISVFRDRDGAGLRIGYASGKGGGGGCLWRFYLYNYLLWQYRPHIGCIEYFRLRELRVFHSGADETHAQTGNFSHHHTSSAGNGEKDTHTEYRHHGSSMHWERKLFCMGKIIYLSMAWITMCPAGTRHVYNGSLLFSSCPVTLVYFILWLIHSLFPRHWPLCLQLACKSCVVGRELLLIKFRTCPKTKTG